MIARKKPLKKWERKNSLSRSESYEKWRKRNTWMKKEKTDAKSYGGSVTPRSGGLWNKPGDVTSESFLFDSKYTIKMSYSVKSETLKKIYIEAIKSGKIPALSVELGDGTEFVALRKDDFLMFISNE